MIITVSGLAGTGTTSVSKMLSKKLNAEYLYAGKIFRDKAEEMNMDIDQFAQFLKDHQDIDRSIDESMITFAENHTKSVLEGRLSAWMVDRAGIAGTKVLLVAPFEVSTERVAYRDELSLEEAKTRVLNRDTVDRERYKTLYNIDIQDESIYDLIIDSSDFTVEEIVEAIIEYTKSSSQ